MAEGLPAYDVVHLLNRFFTRADSIVAENSGTIDNYMGDAVLAVFGVNDERDPALSAVRSGIGVLEVAKELTRYIERIYGLNFKVRVGIDFGEVVFGLMGAESTARETVIGDVVNVASRLEVANKETGTEILATDAVRNEIHDHHVVFGRRFELDLRGKQEQVVAHEVIGLQQSKADIKHGL
jgi:class 3 adenylate cyclase